MSTPKLPNNVDLTKNLLPAEDFECFEIKLTKIVINPQESCVYAVMESNGKTVAFGLNSQEGTILTFVRAGCAVDAHIKTIYQLYMETMQLVKCKLLKVVIEAKRGDVVYARLVWQDHNSNSLYTACSVGDALILSSMANSRMEIVKKALEDLDAMGDFEYDNEIYAE